MAEFYIKNDNGEFVEADDRVEERFHQRSDEIVSKKLSKAREKQLAQIRGELEEEVRKDISKKVRTEVKAEVEGEWQEKLDKAEAKSRQLDADLRRKTIAAEYGFKPELEKYLGNGTDDEMRHEADILQGSLSAGDVKVPEKKTSVGDDDSFVKLTAD